jgi:hypothetical protein
MPIVDQATTSTLSLTGNGFNPQRLQSAWGYIDSTKNTDPAVSSLHNTYDINKIPNVVLKDFNKDGVTTMHSDTTLDELDPRAPKNSRVGAGSVVSQIYKSASGQKYKDKGPKDGRY